MRDAALALLYPSRCRVCEASVESWRDGVACARCWEAADAAEARRRRCEKCALPLPAKSTADRCGACEGFAFARAAACGAYRGPLRESILWLKRHPQIAPRLQEALRAAFALLATEAPIDALVPVQLHAARAAERSYNQAEILARAIRGPRIDTASLVRIRPTEKHRAGMDARDRARSMERAFLVRAPRLVEGRHLLLLDDVMTTGSTLHEAAQTLLAGGARSVRVLTLARAVPEFTQASPHALAIPARR